MAFGLDPARKTQSGRRHKLSDVPPSEIEWAVSAILRQGQDLWHFLNIVNAPDEQWAIKAGRIICRETHKLGSILSVRAMRLDDPSCNPPESAGRF